MAHLSLFFICFVLHFWKSECRLDVMTRSLSGALVYAAAIYMLGCQVLLDEPQPSEMNAAEARRKGTKDERTRRRHWLQY